MRRHDLEYRLLTVADKDRIEERRHRFWVMRAGPPAHHERMGLLAVTGPQGDPRKVKRLEHVGVGKFVGECDAEQVHPGERCTRFQSEQRYPVRAHSGGHVDPRDEHPLACDLIKSG